MTIRKGNNIIAGNAVDIPSQTGNAGKFLTTDGSAASWATVSVPTTDCVHLTGNETVAGIKTFSSTITGSIDGNAATVTNGVYTTGNQTIAGNKSFTGTTTVVTPTVSDNSTKPATTAYIETKFQVVSALPASPDANTYYFIPES